jgi:hypothetical protein
MRFGKVASRQDKPSTQGSVVSKPKRRFARSRISNGSKLLMPDGRSVWSRLFCDVYAGLVAREGFISEPRRMLARRAALLEVEMVCIENSLAAHRAKGGLKMMAKRVTTEWLSSYATLLNAQRRCLESLDLNRTARELVPSLSSYIAEIEAAKADRHPPTPPSNGSEQEGAGLGKFTPTTTAAEDAEVVDA